MKAGNGADGRIRDYLLGKLPESAMEALETEYFENPDVFNRVEIVEDELVSDYLDDNLDSEERARFEKIFLASPSRRERFLFVQTLREKALEVRPLESRRNYLRGWVESVAAALFTDRPGLLARSLLIASLIANLSLGWLALQRSGRLARSEADKTALLRREAELRAEVDGTNATVAQQREGMERIQSLNREFEKRAQEAEAKLARLAGLARQINLRLQRPLRRSSGQIPRLAIPTDALVVGLRLQLEIDAEGYPHYRVSLNRVDGGLSLDLAGLTAKREGDSMIVDFSVAADHLQSGDYRVRLYGVDETGGEDELSQYVFRAETMRKPE